MSYCLYSECLIKIMEANVLCPVSFIILWLEYFIDVIKVYLYASMICNKMAFYSD